MTPVLVQGLEPGVTALSVGYYHACALVSGAVWCWGLNENGQLGNDSTETTPVPVHVQGLGTKVTAISAGANHTCALVDDVAYCWGINNLGELGDGSKDERHLPVEVSNGGEGFTEIEAGEYQTCAIRGGAVVCWGQNTAGHLDLVPTEVSGTNGVLQVSTGANLACALLEDSGAGGAGGEGGANDRGAVCWGENGNGELGNGRFQDSPTPLAVSDLRSIDQICAGAGRACAVVQGAAYCWGSNFAGELGDGTLVDRHLPTPVVGLSSGVTAVALGGEGISCAIVRGRAYCWGEGKTAPELIPLE